MASRCPIAPFPLSISSFTDFFAEVQQRHSLDATQIKEEVHVAQLMTKSSQLITAQPFTQQAQYPTSVSLYSPWAHLYGHPASVLSFPFPSPGFGFVFGDGSAGSGYDGPLALTPPSGVVGMGLSSDMSNVEQVSDSADRYSTMVPNLRCAALDGSGFGDDLLVKRSDGNASVASSSYNESGSGSRIDSSSSGASMASAQCGDAGTEPESDAKTPTPLRLSGISQSYNAFSSYSTYPRAGDQQSTYSRQTYHGPQMWQLVPVSMDQLLHLPQLFQPSFDQNQHISVPPALTQYPSQAFTQEIMAQDRQNFRSSTSTEASSISPFLLPLQTPHIGSSPLLIEIDELLQPISARASPRSQVQFDLPVQSRIGMKKRQSHCSMYTDVEDEGDDVDDAGDVEKKERRWGIPPEAYRSLTAKERRRVRNRISARTFRARRKEHMSALEQDVVDRDRVLKASQGQIKQLREERADLRRRLAHFEPVR